MDTPTTRQTLDLPDTHCDYNGCFVDGTHTDGEWVMCPNHEKTAYRTSTYWRPITSWTYVPHPTLPYYRAEY